MALSTERKRQLALMELPTDQETVKRAMDFLQRSGLTLEEFSGAIGYGPSSLRIYLYGRYSDPLTENHDSSRNTLNIRAALKQYMDLWEGAQPLARQREPRRTQDFERIADRCLQALEQGSAYVIDGPPGTQKTFSLRAVEAEINRRHNNGEGGPRAVYVYARVNHAPQGFLREICNTAGVSGRGTIDQILRKLRFFLGRQRVLLIVDEAQHLGHDGLEVLRQLLDLPPFFGVVLAGSHDLSQRLSHWTMEQWRSRVREKLYLDGPSTAEARAIIRAELQPLLPQLTDAKCDELISGCMAEASRIDHSGAKPVPRKFRYISARDLFFTIEGIQQKLTAASRPASSAAPQKESAA